METRRGSVFATNQPQVLHPKAPDEAPRQDVEASSPRDSRLLRKSRRCGELLRVRGSGSVVCCSLPNTTTNQQHAPTSRRGIGQNARTRVELEQRLVGIHDM